MSAITQYKTKREIDCWPRMKELRRMHFRETWDAQAKGGVVVLGLNEWFLGLLAGLGHYANPNYGPYFTVMMRNPTELVKLQEKMESLGYHHDICSTMKCHLGQVLTGMTTRGPRGETVKPDFVFQVHMCKSISKTGQIASEHLGLPYFVVDLPYVYTPGTREFLIAQMQDAIEWMEKTTGKRYEDERLVEGVKNEWESMVLWAQICTLNQHIPAPLDLRQLWSLRLPMVTLRHRQECVEYLRMLLDEVKDRVANGISARGFEERRLLHEGIPPFFWTGKLFRLPEQYGAIFVGSDMLFTTFGAWECLVDGTWKVPQTPQERGMAIRTREDALGALAELYLKCSPMISVYLLIQKPKELVRRAVDWHAHGAMLHIDRGCSGENAGMLQRKLALQQTGIPAMTYEGSNADPRDMVESQVLEAFAAFMESLGLKRLEAAPEDKAAEEPVD